MSIQVDNFPLVNVTHPDLARHPLFQVCNYTLGCNHHVTTLTTLTTLTTM